MKKISSVKKNNLKKYFINTNEHDWDNLMKITGGFNDGELIVIAARPGCGKTTLALDLALFVEPKYKVLFESLEMSAEELNNKGSKFVKEINDINNVYINDKAGLSLNQIEKDIKKIKPKFVFVDYLQIVNHSINSLTKGLKTIAKENNCIIFALSQLNRLAQDKKPNLSMLRDSGTIEQDANQVWFLTQNQIIIAKNRKGATGEIPIFFNKKQSFIGEDKEMIKFDIEKQKVWSEYVKMANAVNWYKVGFSQRKKYRAKLNDMMDKYEFPEWELFSGGKVQGPTFVFIMNKH